jgi:prepilin-type N-terminal cleavage/methylation domain-containing protein
MTALSASGSTPWKDSRGDRGRAGFTLLETLVAVAILGLGIASVLGLFGLSSRNAARARAATEVVFTAEALLEEAVAMDEPSLRDLDRAEGRCSQWPRRHAGRGGAGTLVRPGDPDCSYAFRVAAEPAEEGVYRVELRVTGASPQAAAVELATFRRFPLDLREEMGA